MSSDDDELTSPIVPQDSDRGSSVSSELQDEYEELLRFAVVTPKYDPSVPIQLSASFPSRGTQTVRGTTSEGEEMQSRTEETTPTESGRSGKSSLSPVMTEMLLSEENLSKMENILDTWSNNLKSNVMMELRKWKLALMEQYRLKLKEEQDKHAAQVASINAEMQSLKDLLNTYQVSNQRKDEVIVNLTRAADRQRERLELMRSFTRWKLKHYAARERVQLGKLAEQHYQLQLKKKVWAAWHSLIQRGWREKAERACRARAEEVCLQLSADYEAKLAEHVAALQKAQTEIERLHMERERYEDSMKKAFMRGVCALNIEALSMFHPGQERDVPPLGDEPSTSSITNRSLRPTSSISMETPVQPGPSRSNTEDTDEDQVGGGTASVHPEALPTSTVGNAHLPQGGSTSSHRQTSGRIVTTGQQKAFKTVTARITGRPELAKGSRNPGNLQNMSVAPPMSSIIVERHHPVTQLTIGQATAAKFPRSALQNHSVPNTKSSSQPRGHSAFHIRSIKVVD